MKNFIFLLLFFSLFSQFIDGQNETKTLKPKVALVLSGGGAKGLAHIPTLQLLDSLGIVPDLLVGNSMGSIVGGLYAMGYSGDSIANIAKNANWDKLIGGGVSLRNVSVEEKSEFNRYLIGMDVVEGKIKSTSFILNDQNLRAFISNLTYPAYNITDFDKLSIPFRAIATDIVNGKEVILDHGSLAFAMRASMSIPGAFSPVQYDNTLLIDGGVLNNFPVDVAKNMGADIIIGSDVGGGMEPKEKLNNIATLLFQTGMLHSNLKNPENKALCDILIEHTPHITYTTGDFDNSVAIYEEGKIALAENKDALVNLSIKLKKFKQLSHTLPYVKDEIILDTIVYNNISKSNLALVKARTNIKLHKKYTKQEILEGINRAMGTTIFSHITFNPPVKENEKGLELNGFERSKDVLKGALHFDSYYGVGVIVNFTRRNFIGRASRSLVTLDIAEKPRLRIQHQKNFGSDRNWWWRSELYGQQLEQDIFISGENVDNLRFRYFDFDNQINRNINSLKSYVGIGLKYQNNHLKPKIDPEFNNNVYDLIKYNYNTIELNAHYNHNSFDKVFYATEGTSLKAYLGRSIHNKLDVDFYNSTFSNIKGSTNNYSKLSLDFEKRFQVYNKATAIIGATSGFIFQDNLKNDDISFTEYGMGSKYYLGGVLLEPRHDNYMLPGLNEGEVLANQFIKLNLGMQFNTANKVYITPHFNIASIGFDDFSDYIDNAFSAKGNWEDAIKPSILISSGAMLSYSSLLGPINFDVSWVNSTNKVRFFIGIGFNLSKS
ncbi:NTE family protein [Flaviramulus basaltis]|uniref:NTE family protein n=1 Tax=Flaviramulus basaltis TaxID=369401 RepID=A0A1K2IGM6_9FLAO|nr:patatin-like phospholipase family protein [Flaviramulus basaltis]SFZ91588.1 NTE family protein [Flaviramulus basaltis]